MKNPITTRPTRSGALVHRGSRARFAPANILLGPRGELWTDHELLALGKDTDTKYELWNGKIISMPPAGIKHGIVIARLMAYLGIHVQQHKFGELLDGQTGFRLSVDECFAPDISFVSRERLKLIQPIGEKLFHGAPDLAVEVLSPGDSIGKTERKIALYLNYGSRLAWLIDPRNKTARIYRPGEDVELLQGERWLTGNSVVPNFRLSLSKLFEGI
jgi:Uma2 family endonuclease